MLNILQFPLYLGMFFAIRYMAFSPEAFAHLHQTSWLYLHSITDPDPYYLIPVCSSLVTHASMRFSKKNMKQGNSNPMMVKVMDVMQYMPFMAVIILGTYPAVLNMYWCSIAVTNYAIIRMINLKFFKKLIGVDKPYPGTILEMKV